MAHKIVKEAGESLGLSFHPDQGTAIGMKDGYPVQVMIRTKGNNSFLTGIVRYDDASQDSAVRETLPGMPEVVQAGIKAKTIEITDGMAIFNNVRGITGFPKVEKFVGNMEALIHSLKGIAAPPGLTCRICRQTSVDQPLLANGVVDRICPVCIEKIQREAVEQEALYETLPMHIPRAVLVAAVMAVIGALVYGGIIILTGRMLWLVAIGIGIGIGFCARKAAGRVGLPIQVLSGLATVVSVLLGLVFTAGYYTHQHAAKAGLTINWAVFATRIPQILMEIGEDTIFSLAGGLIGAYFATRFTRKPDMKVKIER